MDAHRRTFLGKLFGIAAILLTKASMFTARKAFAQEAAKRYECPPCGCSMDGKVFDEPGRCPACRMELKEIATEEQSPEAAAAYICPPCGCPFDNQVFDAPGQCPACNMTLIRKPNE